MFQFSDLFDCLLLGLHVFFCLGMVFVKTFNDKSLLLLTLREELGLKMAWLGLKKLEGGWGGRAQRLPPRC